ncbi:MAG TPA: XdhC/CoxI family protein [Chitinispirillaceae bacterium]|nr:XdhC/CoxI family protein [Chitinispirillaceae bacterium]
MWLKSLTEWKKKGIPCAIATIVKAEGSTPRQAGATMVINIDGDIAGSVGGGTVEYECMVTAESVIKENKPVLKLFSLKGETDGGNGLPCGGICGGEVTVFIEPVVIRKEVIIFGAGHIAEKLSKLCNVLEIPYKVFDDRREFLTEERFPQSTCLIHGEFTKIEESIKPGVESFCVIMTYGHQFDEICLEQLVKITEIPYIGMIGSPKKVSIIMEHLKERNVTIDSRVYTPIGLRIGRNLPQDIALSILAEIVLVMEGGCPEHFRHKWN